MCKTAFITAGADGIGAVIATALMEAGYQLGICDIRSEAVESFQAKNPKAKAFVADVTDSHAITTAIQTTADQFGGLDLLINNAGIGGPADRIENMELADWQRCISVSLDGLFLACKAAIPLMKAAGQGNIINISSTAGLFGYPLRSPYAAAKWGVVGLTKTLAWELGPFNIRVNCVAPGSVEGPRMEWVVEAEAKASGKTPQQVRAGYTDYVALGSFVSADDIANACLWLASNAAGKVSGQILAVDGCTDTLAV